MLDAHHVPGGSDWPRPGGPDPMIDRHNRSLAKVSLICPVCRAANDAGPTCRRCRADLAIVSTVERQHAYAFAAARRAAASGRWDEAIDLAVLDWNLGAGNDGLQLLEDLAVFQPDIVAILVTGYAHQATPLDALRMGVRDYLDKNQDLNRDTFLAAVRKQLDRILPAKRQRDVNQRLAAFRAAVEKVLPLVQSAAALNDPVPLPRAAASLCRFLRP